MSRGLAEETLTGLESPCRGNIDPELVEVSLFVPGWQVGVLDSLARRRGQSLGQLLRGAISGLVAAEPVGELSNAN